METWDALKAQIAAVPKARRKTVEVMQLRHGRTEGRECRDCEHFRKGPFATQGTFYKCSLFGVTSSSATDWRKSYPACGKFVLRGSKAED